MLDCRTLVTGNLVRHSTHGVLRFIRFRDGVVTLTTTPQTADLVERIDLPSGDGMLELDHATAGPAVVEHAAHPDKFTPPAHE